MDLATSNEHSAATLHFHVHTLADLKPENVLVLRDPCSPVKAVAKLTDFGLSEVLGPDQTHASNYRAGTLHYMDPAVRGVACSLI